MQQLDSDYEVVRQPGEAEMKKRFNWLYIMPILGALWLAFLILSAVFQWPISAAVGPVMSMMILIFLLMVGLLFFAMAPKSNR